MVGLSHYFIRPYCGIRQCPLVICQNPLHQHRQADIAATVGDILTQGAAATAADVLPGLRNTIERRDAARVITTGRCASTITPPP